MKAAFFEVTPQERAFLKDQKELKGAALFAEAWQDVPPAAWRDAEAVSPFIYSRATAELIKKSPRLRLIATRSTGYDHVDLAACARRGVAVANVPHYGENTVAEHTFALILSLSRKVHQAYLRTLRGDFSMEGLQGFDLKGKTLGIVGTGRIGLHVARMAQGFGMRVIAFDPRPQTLLAETLGFAYVPFEALLAEADIVTLHTPYSAATRHLVNAENVFRMKKGALLINTARGGVVETEALVRALDAGHLGGAGLDVLEGEELVREETQALAKGQPAESLRTLVQNHILLHRENVVITPHIAFNSREALTRILETTARNIRAFAAGAPENLVNAPAGGGQPSRPRRR